MKPLYILLIAGAVAGNTRAESPLSDPDDAATWQWLLKRARATQHIERDQRTGTAKWVGFYDKEKQQGDFYRGSLTLDAEGRVTKLTFNNANFTNADFKQLAKFKHCTRITAWHNGWNRDKKDEDKAVYSGAGLVHLKDTPVAHFNIGGSWFNDEGMAAAHQLPNLRELKVYHTRVTNAGVNALRGNTHLTYLNLGPQFSQKINAACIADVATIAQLEQLDLNEMLLSWDAGLKHLVALKQLKQLTMKHAYVPAQDLERLRTALPNVDIVYEEADGKQIAQMQKRAGQ